MNIKDSIGLRIKTERERQQMSREVLCLDGAELTVRQLIRIEKGESLPSLDRLYCKTSRKKYGRFIGS